MDERLARRVVVDVEIDAVIKDCLCRVSVTDLSAGGCMVDVGENEIIPGDRILLHFTPWADVSGRMVWMRRQIGGVAFLEPLHEAIVRKMGFRPESDGDAHLLYDRFGRLLPRQRATGAPRF